jgi:hypothetical protein
VREASRRANEYDRCALHGEGPYDSAHLDGNWRTTASFLGDPRGPVKQLCVSLEEFMSKLTPRTHRVGRVIGALARPYTEKDINKILLVIERQKSCFNLALHNDHMY